MAIELITGVGADNHVSSNDFRAFNRANFGQGKYILKDADNMAIDVSASTGTITIYEGSCLWSGMHIRLPSYEQIKYVVPTASQMVYVYLHYVKEATSGVESVSFVISQGETMEPEINKLADNTVEAYTVFCSFIATSSNISNLNCDFAIAKNFEEMEQLIENAHSETTLFDGVANVNSTINLAESFRNFYEIEVIAGAEDKAYPDIRERILTSQIPLPGGAIDVAMFGSSKWSNTNDTYLKVATARLNITNDTTLVYSNGQYVLIGISISEQDDIPIRKIIGIGRKS